MWEKARKSLTVEIKFEVKELDNCYCLSLKEIKYKDYEKIEKERVVSFSSCKFLNAAISNCSGLITGLACL